jgi:hypothetical protein
VASRLLSALAGDDEQDSQEDCCLAEEAKTAQETA